MQSQHRQCNDFVHRPIGAALDEQKNGKDHLVARADPAEIKLETSAGQADKELGARLREIRGGRSREQFGAELKTHRNSIERYEKAKRPNVPHAFLKLVIEKNPGWSLEWLMTGRGEKHGASREVMRAGEPIASYGGTTIDDRLLARVMQEVEEAFGKNYERVSIEKRAALIAAVYEDARSRGQVSHETVLRLLRLAGYP
jgi:hypothetical protein